MLISCIDFKRYTQIDRYKYIENTVKCLYIHHNKTDSFVRNLSLLFKKGKESKQLRNNKQRLHMMTALAIKYEADFSNQENKMGMSNILFIYLYARINTE